MKNYQPFIGISPRVDFISTGEIREAIDQNWAPLLAHFGFVAQVLSLHNFALKCQLDTLPLSGLILSGGNDCNQIPGASNASPMRDQAEILMIEWALKREIPILGVCRGAQLLNLHHGGSLSPIEGHVGERHEVYCRHTATIVNSYHNWCISSDELAEVLNPVALDAQGNVEGFKHQSLPIWGVMWHPEREPLNQFQNIPNQLTVTPFFNKVKEPL